MPFDWMLWIRLVAIATTITHESINAHRLWTVLTLLPFRVS
jgi:hypothetical protein